MATWMLDQSGDLAEENGRPVHVTGALEIGQRIQIRLKWFYGEWFRDRTAGAKWYTYGLGRRNPDLVVLRSMIGLVIRKTTGVIQVESLTVAVSTQRLLTIRATVKVDATDQSRIRLALSITPEPATPETPAEEPTPDAPAEGASPIGTGEIIDAAGALDSVGVSPDGTTETPDAAGAMEPGAAEDPVITII